MLSHRQLLIRATHWKLSALRVEKEQETRQSLAACLLHIRPVGVCQPVSHSHRVRSLQHNSGDRVYFNTTAVTECTSTQQRWQSVLQHNSGDRAHFNTTAVIECTSTQQRWQSVLQHNSGDRAHFNTTAVIECTSTQQRWQSVLQHNSGDRVQHSTDQRQEERRRTAPDVWDRVTLTAYNELTAPSLTARTLIFAT